MTAATAATASGFAPPHSLDAEMSVLGGVLLSDRALPALIFEEGLLPDHFYRERHRIIWAAMVEMHAAADGASATVDVLTLTEYLRAAGSLEAAGGRAAIDELTGGVPGLGGIRKYAQIVIRHWRWRGRLTSTYEQQAAISRSDEDAFEAALGTAQGLTVAYGVTDGYLGPDALADHMMRWLEEKPEAGLPLPAELPSVARMVRLRAGHVTVVGAWPSGGKALDVTTPIDTPQGWRTMGELRDGDEVYGSDGAPVRVVKAWPVMHDRPCFRVKFRGGAELIADEDHLWTVCTRASRRSVAYQARMRSKVRVGNDQTHKRAMPSTLTTGQLRELLPTLTHGVSIPVAGPIQRPSQDLPIDPYILGYWLGDGTSESANITVGETDAAHVTRELAAAGLRFKVNRWGGKAPIIAFTSRDPERCLRGHVRAKGVTACPGCWGRHGDASGPVINVSVRKNLRAIGVLGDKHIPDIYMDGSVEQRWALLQGLMDSDGTVDKRYGECAFSVTNKRLAEGAWDLALSLGLRPRWRERAAKLYGREVSRSYEMVFSPHRVPFRMERKARFVRPVAPVQTQQRYITSIEPVDSVPVRCITVDAPDHLYLAGREYIATHNTASALQLAASIGAAGHRVVIWSNEDTAEELVAKHVMAATGIPASIVSDRRLTDSRMKHVLAELGRLPFEVQPCHDWSAAQVASHIRQVRPAVAIVDHFHNLAGIGKVTETDEAIRVLAAVAGQAGCHLILCAQLNRNRMSGVCKPPPVAADLRGSGMFLAAAHTLILVHRDEEESEDTLSGKTGKAVQLATGSVDVAKNKVTGQTGIVRVSFDARRLRFVEGEVDDPVVEGSAGDPF